MSSTPEIFNDYFLLLDDVKKRIREAQSQAARSVNTELLGLYGYIGRIILQLQDSKGWGSSVVERLSSDLRNDFPSIKGFSERNLRYMKMFAHSYLPEGLILQPVVAEIPWSHHTVILTRCKSLAEKMFYIEKAAENGWSKKVVQFQIDSQLFVRQGKALTNFERTLPASQSDLARELLKNPYNLDFLELGELSREKDLENGLIDNLQRFMLELGRGFAFVGRQFNLKVEGDDFFLDLLFYNYKLHCFVVVELKIGDFESEFIGKLNFYVEATDKQLRKEGMNPTIGLLLCSTPNHTVVKYSLSGIEKPIGVSSYELTKQLTSQLKPSLPTIEELEDELERGYQKAQTLLQKKLNALRESVKGVRNEQLDQKLSAENFKTLFERTITPLHKKLIEKIQAELGDMFLSIVERTWTGSEGHASIEEAQAFVESYSPLQKITIEIRLQGFKKLGIGAFDLSHEVVFSFQDYFYSVAATRDSSVRNLYPTALSEEDQRTIVEYAVEEIVDQIQQRLEQADLN